MNFENQFAQQPNRKIGFGLQIVQVISLNFKRVTTIWATFFGSPIFWSQRAWVIEKEKLWEKKKILEKNCRFKLRLGTKIIGMGKIFAVNKLSTHMHHPSVCFDVSKKIFGFLSSFQERLELSAGLFDISPHMLVSHKLFDYSPKQTQTMSETSGVNLKLLFETKWKCLVFVKE